MASEWPKIIEDLRREKGISQRALARVAGVCRSKLRRAYKSGGRIGIYEVDRMLNVLGYELDAHRIDGGASDAD